MHSGAAPKSIIERPPSRQFTVTPALEVIVLAIAIVIAIASYFIVSGDAASQRLLTPPIVALLLIANLVPGVALLVLIGRRVAMRRAARSPIGGGQLHVRLVALFSLIAAVPMILVTIIASLLFQYGVEFWISDRARGMFDNAQTLAQQSYQEMLSYVDKENVAMSADLSKALVQYRWPIDSPEFTNLFAQDVFQRSLSEAVVFLVSPSGEIRTIALVNPYDRALEKEIDPGVIRKLNAGTPSVVGTSRERTRSVTRIGGTDLYLYAARVNGAQAMADRMTRMQGVLSDYRALQMRSRTLQLQFNAALLLMSLLIVGIAVFVALQVADRLVRPVGELVDAARRVAGGDLTARVANPPRADEIGTLATAFNSMTDRLQEQTGALENRRALIEAVLSGVTAGVVSVDPEGAIRLMNSSAIALLMTGDESPVAKPIAMIAPELAALIESGAREGVVQHATGGEPRTLAVKIARAEAGPILTFDDITQQLRDQRTAAWSDVARRIAHEIKNPLTPIQLAAERLQRRYGKTIDPADGTFARLTETIVRQVGDLRRMVDEFSSFARMPKPVFREESLVDIARQALFLHEVAHPSVDFALVHDDAAPTLVCDRRQIGQALTNLVKNAVEAVEAKDQEGGTVTMTLAGDAASIVTIAIADNGIGLPIERDRIVEPYMTTRARGTGLGLAIVKKIAEEHCGSIAVSDREGGGTVVTMSFDAANLSSLDCGADAEIETSDEPRAAALTLSRNS
ncbi:PAS domain-containing sensor histidine kinase [soil metagenome]